MFPILIALSFLLLTDCVIAKMVIVTATQEIEITTTTEEEVYTVFIPPKECSASRYLNYSYDPKIIHIGIEKSEFSFNVYFSYKGRKQIANLRKAFHLALHNDVPQRFFLVWTISRRILVYHLPPHSEHLKFQEFTPSTFGRYLKWEENVGGFYRNGTTYFGAGRDVYFNRTFRVGANGAYDREWCKSYGHRDVVDKHCMSNCNFQPNNVSSDTVECVYDPYSRLHFTVKRKKNPPYHWNAYYMSYACNIFLESSIYDFPTNPDVNQPASVLLHWYEPDLKDGDRLELHPEEANCYVLDGGNHILLDADWFDNPPTSCSQLNITLPTYSSRMDGLPATIEPPGTWRIEKKQIMVWIIGLGVTTSIVFLIWLISFIIGRVPASREEETPLPQSSDPALTSSVPAPESSGLPGKEPSSGAIGDRKRPHEPSSGAIGDRKK